MVALSGEKSTYQNRDDNEGDVGSAGLEEGRPVGDVDAGARTPLAHLRKRERRV